MTTKELIAALKAGTDDETIIIEAYRLLTDDERRAVDEYMREARGDDN